MATGKSPTNAEIAQAVLGASRALSANLPYPTDANFSEFAAGVLEYPQLTNLFVTTLINVIGRTYVDDMYVNNPLRFLRGEEMPYGGTIREIYTGLSHVKNYDADGKETLDKVIPDVEVLYHAKNYDLMFKTTINDKELRLAFDSVGGLSELTATILQRLYDTSELYAYMYTKRLLSDYKGFTVVPVPTLDGTDATAKQFGKTVKRVMMDMRFLSTKYNSLGVYDTTPEDRGLLLLTVDVSTSLDYDYLANVFNLTLAELKSRTIILDNIDVSINEETGMYNNKIQAVYCDERFFQIHYLNQDVEAQRNAEGRFTNYTKSDSAIYSVSRFRNAVAFVDAATPTFNVVFVDQMDPMTGAPQQKVTRIGFNGGIYTPTPMIFSTPQATVSDPKLSRGKFKGWSLVPNPTPTDVIYPIGALIPNESGGDMTVYTIREDTTATPPV